MAEFENIFKKGYFDGTLDVFCQSTKAEFENVFVGKGKFARKIFCQAFLHDHPEGRPRH